MIQEADFDAMIEIFVEVDVHAHLIETIVPIVFIVFVEPPSFYFRTTQIFDFCGQDFTACHLLGIKGADTNIA